MPFRLKIKTYTLISASEIPWQWREGEKEGKAREPHAGSSPVGYGPTQQIP